MSESTPTPETAPDDMHDYSVLPAESTPADTKADTKPIAAPKPKPKSAPTPTPTPTPTPATKTNTKPYAPARVPRAVYGKGDWDDVLFSRVVGAGVRKSLTVKHLQRRLTLLGYGEANADRDGQYGALTARAVSQWQRDNGYDVGVLTRAQFTEIFGDDPNVKVVLD